MFCSECGTKNKKGAAFCENCGAKLKTEEAKAETKKTETKASNTQPTKASSQGKIIGIIVGAAVAFIIILFSVISAQLKPEAIVKKYMKAQTTNDYKTLYKYEVNIENGDKTFTSLDAYKTIKDNIKSKKVLNYEVGKAEYDLGKLTSSVTVNYTEEGSTDSKEVKVKLKKSNKKAFLFFDKWIIANAYTDSSIIKDYKITVPTGAKVVYAGVKVNKKYLSKKDSSTTNDVYVLNQVLPVKTPIKVTLKNGIEAENTTTPYSYNSGYKFYLTSDSVSDKLKNKISKQAITDLNDLYAGAIAKTEFSKLKNKNFDKKLEKNYNDYIKRLESQSYKLKTFEITKAEIKRLSTNSDDTVRVSIYCSYKYQLDAENSSERTSTRYIYLDYDLNSNNYKLTGVDSLPIYFYR